MPDIDIEIDGKLLKAPANSMIIQVADAAGIYIPRFCYHKHLSIAANCRMCLVEVEKSPKTLPACATPITPGMKVYTRSQKATAAQKAVMEFLLINHPLDCPICDQGGECELQDLSMGYGSADSFYSEGKRSVKDKDLGPLIASDMTRCIQCTRCVRFGDEVAGLRELGATGRGEHTEIGTYIQHAIHSEVSGNVIDLCPVGALTSKPFRFTARAWELNQYPSIAPHDCIGTHINIHTRYGRVMRVVPREKEEINQTWISDRDRYSYEGLYHPDRIQKPVIRIHGERQETSWQVAFDYAAKRLQHVIECHGADAIGALISPNATVEECYLLQKIMRQLGSQHIDHRLRQSDFSDEDALSLYPSKLKSLADIETYDQFLLIGSNIQREQPTAALRIRKAIQKGANASHINFIDYPFHFKISQKQIIAPHDIVTVLGRLLKILSPNEPHLEAIQPKEEDRLFIDHLKTGKKVLIILGALAFNHPKASLIRFYAKKLSDYLHGDLLLLPEGSNAHGATIASALPYHGSEHDASRVGLDANEMLLKPRQAYLLFNVEPDLDCGNPIAAVNALEMADCVIAFSSFKNPILEKYATVILPITPFTETSGTRVNVLGDWQTFQGVAEPYEDARPGWKVLRVLGNFLHLKSFDYTSSDEIKDEVQKHFTSTHTLARERSFTHEIPSQKSTLTRIGEIPIYVGDSLVRRATALQKTQTIIQGKLDAVHMHPNTATSFGLQAGDILHIKQQAEEIDLPLILDPRIAEMAVLIAGGILLSSGLPHLFGEIEIMRK